MWYNGTGSYLESGAAIMKNVVKFANQFLWYVRLLIFFPGLCLVAIFATLGLAYLRGAEIAGVRPDFTPAIIGADGAYAYYWVGLLGIWLILEAIHWGVKIRSWWIHRESIKSDMKKLLSKAKVDGY
jgi:hypothetical protein